MGTKLNSVNTIKVITLFTLLYRMKVLKAIHNLCDLNTLIYMLLSLYDAVPTLL